MVLLLTDGCLCRAAVYPVFPKNIPEMLFGQDLRTICICPIPPFIWQSHQSYCVYISLYCSSLEMSALVCVSQLVLGSITWIYCVHTSAEAVQLWTADDGLSVITRSSRLTVHALHCACLL